MSVDRAQMQEAEYAFPYHYLPNRPSTAVSNVRYLRWGWEYACYLYHLAGVVDALTPATHLDVGCGDGRLFHVAAARRRRVGVDFSSRSLDYARAFNPGVEFYTDLDRLDDDRFDLVSAVEVLEHVPDDEVGDFLQGLARRVVPGGHLLLSVPSTAIPKHPKHYRHYDEALLRSQIKDACPQLELLHFDHIYRRSRLVDGFTRLTLNRWLVLDVAPLRYGLWNYVWHHLRRSAVGQGRHLLGVFRQPPP